MLPAAQLVVDLFHVVQLAVKVTGDVRRRAVREKYGRRSRSGDAEYGVKGLLVRNLEHLSAAQFAKVMDTLGTDAAGQQILAAWIGKEKLRDALNLRARITRSTPCERDVRGRLFSFYDWCAQNNDIPELVTLARTISRWEEEIVAAVLTGVSNARSEALNRIATRSRLTSKSRITSLSAVVNTALRIVMQYRITWGETFSRLRWVIHSRTSAGMTSIIRMWPNQGSMRLSR